MSVNLTKEGSCAGRIVLVHPVCGKRREFQKRRAGVEQLRDTVEAVCRNDYSTSLKLFPSSVPLQKAAGRLDVELDRAEEAAPLLARVLAAPDMGGAMLVMLDEVAPSGPDAAMDSVMDSIHANPAFSVDAMSKAVAEALKKRR